MTPNEYEALMTLEATAAKATGYDYAESRLSPLDMDEARLFVPHRVDQYELGIITGGELDCVVAHGMLPTKLYATTRK